MLIFGGVDRAAQGVRHPPELGFVADVRGRTIDRFIYPTILLINRLCRYANLSSAPISSIAPAKVVARGWQPASAHANKSL